MEHNSHSHLGHAHTIIHSYNYVQYRDSVYNLVVELFHNLDYYVTYEDGYGLYTVRPEHLNFNSGGKSIKITYSCIHSSRNICSPIRNRGGQW